MKDRYFSETAISGTSVTLDGSEAHHLLHVMRAKSGMEVTVFDGRGGEWSAQVAKLRKAEVELTLGKHDPIERELTHEIILTVCLPKGDRQRWLIEKAVELGVTRLVPLTTERSTKSAAETPAKLTRYVIEASKQCGRNRLMEIESPQSWSELVACRVAETRILAHPGGNALSEVNYDGLALIAIGPEGGFTNAEVEQAEEHGWQNVSLGERILRIETAALVLVSKWVSK